MHKTRHLTAGFLLAGLSMAALTSAATAQQTVVDFYYPIQVGGPLTQVIDGYVAEFEAANPDIDIVPVYSGNYQDTTTKALTAAKAGDPPALAVLLATDIFTLIDEDVIDPIDSFFSPEDQEWVDGFMPAYLASARVDGNLWSVPFQRSTAVLYWNKDAFAEAGLDPEKYPATWDEMVEFGKAVMTKDANGNVTRWGVGIPGNPGSAQWLFTALAAQNGARLMNDEGNEVYLTDPKVVEALQFWRDLSVVHGVHPPGIQEWGTTPSDFLEGRIAMVWTTTGNLTNILNNATFDFGLAPYPGNPDSASALGGGNLYVFKDASDEEKAAAMKFAKFLTSDELQADWAIQTGYVAPRDGSWETDTLKDYVAEVPAADVARQQIPTSVPEYSTHENARTTKVLNDAIAAALTGGKSPEQALSDAQAEIDRILRSYR
ncbi:ABC transporter substrate-binding protein [Devosia honganensis]|uniref:ABC transporter substrate-binding protein n=1 Tax=Devosia honganensis TaxID=1610527 RepID=A0ABV7WWC9_9HYPH